MAPQVQINIFFTYIYTDVGVGKDGVLAPYETLIPLYLPNTDLVNVISNSVLHGDIGRQGWYLHPYFLSNPLHRRDNTASRVSISHCSYTLWGDRYNYALFIGQHGLCTEVTRSHSTVNSPTQCTVTKRRPSL